MSELAALQEGAESPRAMHCDSAQSMSITVREAAVQCPHDRRFSPRLARHFEEARLDEITPEAMVRGEKAIYPRAKLRTKIRQYWAVLNRLYKWAAQNELCKPRRIRVPPTPKDYPRRLLTVAEEVALLREAGDHIRLPILLELKVGLRPGEVRELQWGQFVPQRRLLFIPKKGGRLSRRLALPDEVIAEMNRHHVRDGDVCRKPDGESYEGRGFLTALRDACDRAKIKRVTEQMLRDTWAIRQLEGGCSLSTLQELGGWADLRMPARYRALLRKLQQDDTSDTESERGGQHAPS